MEERRKHKRLDLEVMVELERLDEESVTTLKYVHVEVTDISRSGLGFKSKADLEIGSYYDTRIQIWTKEVVDAVYEQMCQVLDQGNIEYVKWDMNRSMAEVYSMTAEEQGSVQYDYMLGLYDFLERIISRYPDLLIEGCSGGGGRFDAGMLYYTPQIWCSDNTDAVDRVRIQYGTSFGYPVSAVGSHVSAVPNHQTGRKTSLHTRGVCAMAGTFGYELDPAKMTDEERKEIREQIVK